MPCRLPAATTSNEPNKHFILYSLKHLEICLYSLFCSRCLSPAHQSSTGEPKKRKRRRNVQNKTDTPSLNCHTTHWCARGPIACVILSPKKKVLHRIPTDKFVLVLESILCLQQLWAARQPTLGRGCNYSYSLAGNCNATLITFLFVSPADRYQTPLAGAAVATPHPPTVKHPHAMCNRIPFVISNFQEAFTTHNVCTHSVGTTCNGWYCAVLWI